MGTVTPKSSIWSSAVMILFSVVLLATMIASNPINEDPLGSSVPRGLYRSHESIPSPEDNMIPITLDGGPQGIPVLYDPHLLNVQQPPMDNAILNYLLARRLMIGNSKLRSYLNGFDTSSNEISRKRSYSKYCAFNAVSCFGRK